MKFAIGKTESNPAGYAIMLGTKVICPHCRKHLKTSKPLAAGHRVLCSRCGRSFAVGPDIVNGAAEPPQPTLPQPSPRLDSAHFHAGSSAATPPLPGRKFQSLWIVVVFGGLALLTCVTVGLVLILATKPKPVDTPIADGTASAEASETPIEPPPNNPRPPEPNRREEKKPRRSDGDNPPRLADPPPPAVERAAWLPSEEQEKVNKAIDRGVQWFRKHQTRDGGWGPRGGHAVGLAALPALTLRECGVSADDDCIQKALQMVRKAIPGLNQTYELSLAILFLDRLGDPADEKHIQTCALRLVAGQSAAGGWTYTCRILSPEQERDLLTVLRQTRPASALDLFVRDPDGSAPPGFLAQDLSKNMRLDSSLDAKLLPPDDARMDKVLDPAAYKEALNRLPADLKNLPALQPPAKAHNLPSHDHSDNSNTQFAILGLSAAHKHGLPLERALALIVQRFHKSQLSNGRWNYPYSSPPNPGQHFTPAMTGAGLLGLAVGLGLAADQARRPTAPGRFADPAIEKGFDFLGQFIGKPLDAKKTRNRKREPINLYFLWTVERCGVLFNRRVIGGKDWYQWGTELLLEAQRGDGSWTAGGYPGSTPLVDTSFALLFLKRANLAKNLTKKLEFFMESKQLQDR